MSQANAENLISLIQKFKSDFETDPEQVHGVPIDPACDTYEVGDYWVKILKAEPKNRDFTILHREYNILDQLDRFNRSTLDLNLHVPLTRPIGVESNSEFVERPALVVQKIDGEPIARSYAAGDSFSNDEKEKIGEQIGRFLARIHSIQVKGAGLISVEGNGVHPGPWQKYFGLMADTVMKHVQASQMLDEGLVQQLLEFGEKSKSVMIGESLGLTHNNLQFANLWVDREQKKITGFVNFTQAAAGSPLVDICSLYTHVHEADFYQLIHDGYEAQRSFPPKYKSKLNYYGFIFGVQTALFFHMRKDEAARGYFLRRALQAAAGLDDRFESAASRYASFENPPLARG